MTENEANIYSIAYRDCKEVSDSIDVNEEFGKANTILFYMDEILESLKIASELHSIGTIEEFNALKDAEEQGSLLPYKIGDKFYEPIEWKNCAEECKISSFTIKADGGLKIRLSGTYGVFEITTDKIGKTVFFTKEEAEKELAKRKSK